jgi:hypothetical protein
LFAASYLLYSNELREDAKLYLEKLVNETLEALRQIEAEETEP